MAMQWSASLSVGVDLIDTQHQELFRRINSLLAAMGQGQGQDEIAKTLKFLEEYVVSHFAAEEKLMQQHAYPHVLAHKRQHADFMTDLGELKKEFLAKGATSSVVLKVQRRVCDWLPNHIGRTDSELGKFLKTRM